MEIKSNETKWFFSYRSFLFSAAVAIAPFEIYGWKIHRFLNFNMLFQFLLSKLSKSELFSRLQKVNHVTNYFKRLILGHPVLRWLQLHRALERGAFIFHWLNSLFSIKVIIIVNSRLVDISLLRISRWYGSSWTPGKNDWNKLGSPLQTLYVKDSPSPAYTQLREMTVSICLPLFKKNRWLDVLENHMSMKFTTL